MSRSRSLSGLVVSLFTIVAALVAVVFVVQLIALVSLRDDTQSGSRTTDLLTASYNTEISLLDMETGLRGYLLTQRTPFLAPYRSARAAIGTDLARLRSLASGASEMRRVMMISSQINSYVKDYAVPLIATGGRLSDRQAAAATSRGRRLVDAIRPQFGALDAYELSQRQHRRSTLASQTTQTIAIAATGLGISVLMLLALGAYVLRSVLRPIREVARAQQRRRQGDLTARVPETGRGEVAQLERSFNTMAEGLERRTNELSDANSRLEDAVAVAEAASRMKSDFLANMSHEIRTPLNGVVGMVTLLSGTPLSSEQREYIEMARGASDTLINVVSDILDVSKIEAGRLELELQDFDLHDLIGTTRDMLRQDAGGKGLALTVAFDDDVPRAVRGDRLRVGQVLGNLLSNAVKFTAEGEVELRASVAERTNVATVVRFTVRDTGIGIAPERLATLFDPFVQADVSTTRQYGGSGLGLTICRDLTRLMGGTLGAESERGKGSKFTATIPFAPALGALVPAVASVELRGLRVLVVDDNAANRRIIEAYVAAWGMRSRSARDADQAVAQLLTAADDGAPFDVALLDFNMPGENGFELARRIAGAPRLRSTRLILLSSTGASLAELNANGIGHQLTKPISQSNLLDAIAVALHSELPSGAVRSTPEPPASVAPLAGVAARAPALILIAEDNLVNRTYVERLLTRLGHKVTSAVDGHQVLEAHDAGSYDLILMDCQMPELDGYETTREIRHREAVSGARRTPIVAMTAAATEDIRAKCLDAGMDDYLTKPLAGTELQRALAQWLPTPAASITDALDPARVAHLRSLFPGLEATEVLVQLANQVELDLGKLAAAVDAGDRAGIVGAAHSIRGSAQMVGAVQLSDSAADVQHAAKREEEDLSPRIESLRNAWDQTRQGIEAQVAEDRRGYHQAGTD
jgi:two-component system sensor histidine kinase/response regulator